MPRRALLIGINSYGGGKHLQACVADAEAMTSVLARHKDGKKNFDCITWADKTGAGTAITRADLRTALNDLFAFDGDVLLYFSGHGFLSTTGGVLCTSDATTNDWGVQMQEVVTLASASKARQILIVLDCCHSGDFANPAMTNTNTGVNPLATVRENLTVIAASRAQEGAIEAGGHGLFTGALVDALEGGAADHMGYVSAPALYTYVRRRFAAWDQCPVFKTNATDVFHVRECEPLISRLQLQRLPDLFPKANSTYQLDPEFEPEDEHGNVKQPVDQDKVGIAQLLKSYRDAGLLKSSEPGLQFYWVARQSKTVELTLRGQEYWWLVVNDKI